MKQLPKDCSSLKDEGSVINARLEEVAKSIDKAVALVQDNRAVIIRHWITLLLFVNGGLLALAIFRSLNRPWSAFGWWSLGVMVFSIFAFLWTFVADRTAVLKDNARHLIMNQFDADKKFVEYRLVARAIEVFERHRERYRLVYIAMSAHALAAADEAVADRYLALIVHGRDLLIRAFALLDIACEQMPADGSKSALGSLGKALSEFVDDTKKDEFKEWSIGVIAGETTPAV